MTTKDFLKKESKKTRIMAIGDIHGDSGLVKRLAEKAKKENIDIVILAGDLTFINQPVKNIIKPFIDAKKQVVIVPGNHETNVIAKRFEEVYAGTKNLHGYYLIKGNLGIFGAGGATDIGPFVTEEQEISYLLKRGGEKIKNLSKKIMVTHMHPSGTKSEFSGVEGSKAIRDAVKEFKPDFLLHGHIHEAAGLKDYIGKTKIINVTRKEYIFEI